MTTQANSISGDQPKSPRPVSRGLDLQPAFVGLDSLYLVLEYPAHDVFQKWASQVGDLENLKLHAGLPAGDFVIRRGALGYKLSVWDGDARLFLTDRVEERLYDTAAEGQGMGIMLQLGPKWLCRYGDIISPDALTNNVLAQLRLFGVPAPERFPIRLNRLDIAIDVLGLDVAGMSIDEWRSGWVGYASRKDFHDSSHTGKLEGFSIGSSQGAVRFKVYNKEAESRQRGTSRFWRSVWGVGETDDIAVTRFEWSIKCYQARFVNIRYLPEFSFDGFLRLLNYVSVDWGSLRVPQADDSNQTRWPLSPLWAGLRALIEAWGFNFKGIAHRDYTLKPDLSTAYLRSATGWFGGLLARLGLEYGTVGPVELADALKHLEQEGFSISDKADEKWLLLSKLTGRK